MAHVRRSDDITWGFADAKLGLLRIAYKSQERKRFRGKSVLLIYFNKRKRNMKQNKTDEGLTIVPSIPKNAIALYRGEGPLHRYPRCLRRKHWRASFQRGCPPPPYPRQC